MYSAKKPLVAIVGRPNVGKSTLFNRLVGRPVSIVSDIAGTTRDRVSTETVWAGYPFILVDTGGLDERNDGGEATPTQIWEKVRSQIDVAIEDADVIVMLTDVGTGLTPADYDVAEALRRARKSVIVAVNKSDNEAREQQVFDFYDLGLGDPIPISAYHNVGVDDLMSRVIASLPVRARRAGSRGGPQGRPRRAHERRQVDAAQRACGSRAFHRQRDTGDDAGHG